jgi:signal transduction histidine kinase
LPPIDDTRSTRDLVRIGLFVVAGVCGACAAMALFHCGVAHGHAAFPDGASCALRIVAVAVAASAAASFVFYRSARDFTDDLAHLTNGIDRLVSGDVIGDPIAVRTYDALGILTKRFTSLRDHFATALARERAARRAVEDADSYKSQFLTAVSHELRTPLNAVLGFADVLVDGIDGPINEAQREDLLLIRSAGAHLMDLFNDVLDLAAAASGGLRLERKRVAVAPLISKVVAEQRVLCVGRDLTLGAELPADLPDVHADPRRLRQILVNLIENAIKFTEHGSVRVTAEATVDGVRIRVVDTGVGIARDELESIFEEFEQTAAEGRRGRGAGLGLAICRRLAELQGGTIRAESEPKKGSVFTLSFPAARKRS